METMLVEDFEVKVSKDRKGYVMTIAELPEFKARAVSKEEIKEVVTRSILAYLHAIMDKKLKLQKKKELGVASHTLRRESIRKK